VVKKVEDLIDAFNPDVIFTHHESDLNVDHQVTFRAVLTATRPIEGHPVRDLYAFEIASSTEWSFHQRAAFHPNVFFDISSTLEQKKRAMAHYESELREFPHPRSLHALEVIARRWGSVVGCQAAEAFQLVRSIRL
jgi:LmbE family N-acetylglucosaminyl deacetylase